MFDIYYRKDGEDLFEKEPDFNHQGFVNGWLEIIDVDGDADNDIVYSGENKSGQVTNGRILNICYRAMMIIGESRTVEVEKFSSRNI